MIDRSSTSAISWGTYLKLPYLVPPRKLCELLTLRVRFILSFSLGPKVFILSAVFYQEFIVVEKADWRLADCLVADMLPWLVSFGLAGPSASLIALLRPVNKSSFTLMRCCLYFSIYFRVSYYSSGLSLGAYSWCGLWIGLLILTFFISFFPLRPVLAWSYLRLATSSWCFFMSFWTSTDRRCCCLSYFLFSSRLGDQFMGMP